MLKLPPGRLRGAPATVHQIPSTQNCEVNGATLKRGCRTNEFSMPMKTYLVLMRGPNAEANNYRECRLATHSKHWNARPGIKIRHEFNTGSRRDPNLVTSAVHFELRLRGVIKSVCSNSVVCTSPGTTSPELTPNVNSNRTSIGAPSTSSPGRRPVQLCHSGRHCERGCGFVVAG